MASATLPDSAPSTNGHRTTTPTRTATLEELSAGWSTVKRDGKTVPFDVNKVRRVVDRCFQSIGMADADRPAMVEKIARGVVYALLDLPGQKCEVEEVQRLVIRQLFVEQLFEAGEHYQNYRESRRVSRLEREVPASFAEQVEKDQHHFPTDLQYYQFISKFSRWREEDKRRETWRESCNRVMNWFRTLPMAKLDEMEWGMLDDALYNLEASPAMRVVQMAGPALDRCNIGVYNCAYHPIEDLEGFSELLYILMQGSGSGFSVEYDYIGELPKIRKQRATPSLITHVIGDSTEGWCDAFLLGLQRWFSGEDVEFDYSQIRPAGTRLKTKGGRSSGPEPLKELLTFARSLILSRQGKRLTDFDVHCLCCVTGKIVQVGGVRRASCISLSDLDSHAMRHAKSGNWYDARKYLSMANNSAVYDGLPPMDVFMDEWVALMRSGSGERGIFNREAAVNHLPKRRKRARFGLNPCGEIILRPYGLCNLSICVARPDDTEETLLQKVTVATYFGVVQSTATNFRYVRDTWKKNCEEERLIGVDITGHADCPLLRYGAPGRDQLLAKLKARVAETAEMLSTRFGINRPAADTTVKPSGDSAVFFDCGSGISARFAAYQIRNVREPMHSPVARFLIDAGVPYCVAPEDKTLYVFSFPKKAPAGATLRDDMTAIQQCENWLQWKQGWAEHSVSATIYVAPEEWLEVGAWVYKHFDHITGLSFLPKDNGSYKSAPNEELTEAQYEEMVSKFPCINWSKLMRYETEDCTEAAQTLACSGDKCELN